MARPLASDRLLPARRAAPALPGITCTRDFNDKSKTYANRLVVEATYAGLD
jgi:hypothetical protein